MAQKKIHIVWANGRTINIQLESNPAAEYYYRCIKHLQHVDLEFNPRKNPLHAKQLTQDEVINNLVAVADQLNLNIDRSRITDQEYLNFLHSIYFDNAKVAEFDTMWLALHDYIHLLEEFCSDHIDRHSIYFDYEGKAGPLIRPFDRDLLQYATTEIAPGLCTLREHELGKNLLLYKLNNEPLEIEKICQVAKPWVLMKPLLNVGFKHNEKYQAFKEAEEESFNQWFAPFKQAWCSHWNVPNYDPREMFSAIPIGHIDKIDEFIDCFTRLDYPQRLAL